MNRAPGNESRKKAKTTSKTGRRRDARDGDHVDLLTRPRLAMNNHDRSNDDLLKNKLAAAESRLAAQQTELLRRDEQLEELKSTLNETQHKLNRETTNGINLESTLNKCRDDLQTEKLASQNAAAALFSAQQQLKEHEKERRGLELNLTSMSHTSDSTNARILKLEKEKSTLENRIRELQTEIIQHSPAPTATPARSRAPSRRRSSSVSDARVNTLEQELKDTRVSLAQKDTELRTTSIKLAQAQSDLFRVENEKIAGDKRFQTQLADLRAELQERDGELEYLREQQGGSREDELLQRIDEDEAKTAALERQLGEASREHDRLRQQLQEASDRVLEAEDRNIELVAEREEALGEMQGQIDQLSEVIRQKDTLIANQSTPQLHTSAEDVERLLGAIDRIRGERDNLRRDVEFLQNEARFTEEALRSRIAALEQTSPVDPQLQAQVQALQLQLVRSSSERDEEIRRLGRVAMASAIVIEHLRSHNGVTAQQFLSVSTSSEGACDRLRETDLLVPSRRHSGELHTQQLMFDTTQDRVAQLETQVGELSQALDDLTAERDSLNLQTTNLTRDLETAKRDIADAETRYTELQFHQLSSMTVNAATEALRQQLADQEQRVLRRTELVGILQHDNQRMETNMKLQEERLLELAAEVEVLAAQKDAMVEDCAEARHARDVAVARVEEIEVEMEAIETRAGQAESAVEAMVGVVFANASRSRHVQHGAALEIQKLKEQLAEKDRMITDNDLEGEIAALRPAHVEELGSLQRRLVELTSALDETQARCEAAEANYRQALADSTHSREEFEAATGTADKLESELRRLQEEHVIALQALQEQLASAVADTEAAKAAHEELDIAHQQLVKQLAEGREDSEERVQALEERVAELEVLLEEQTARCASLSEEADALRDQVERQTELGAADKARLEAAIQDATTQREDAENDAEDSREQLASVQEELARARLDADVVQEEKTALQEQVTLLQADKQRALSLHRYLESQVKDKEVQIANLSAEIDEGKVQLSRVDKERQAAQFNLNLLETKQRREVSELQRQVVALQAQPDLQTMVVDLEESNREKDELLVRKNAELEEYDERAIDILKTNKQLKEKVDSLTRKIQKLQAKVDAAKATSVTMVPQRESPPMLAQPRPRTNTFSSMVSTAASTSSLPSVSSLSTSMSMPTVPPIPPVPSHIPRSPARSRVASASALPRPKTPERKAIPTVFRAKTPERRPPVFIPPSPSAPVLGQKRRAPDDFENVQVPAQGFTADSLPDDGTPRVRRALNPSGGFTPVRRAEPSPGMAVRSATHISDVTNSPRLDTTAKAKRSWLGRIKGSTAAGTGRPLS
ncbi:hypothetical protein HMN09_00657700 [Mycena chlorophos]|uniref:Uncharacterized protein n=1 Tax=Mycena chlorophos TaxID=658473 RepID=A0A8H6T2Z7_MYCCL|nr:hypothetical protein HMN09_00657700 [Mycena chlorophos]